jgi:HlyD family secretion protein
MPCACRIGNDPETYELSPRTVDVIRLSSETVPDPTSLIGRIEPWREAALHFEVAGVIAEVLVDEGATVAADDPIARLVPDDYELAISQAKAELDVAMAKLSQLRAGTRAEDLEAARAAHAKAQVRSTYWIKQLARMRKLVADQAADAASLDEAQREHDAAIQEERHAKAVLDRAIAGPRREDIDAAAAEVEARKEVMALARRQRNKAILRAPFGGRVERRYLHPGAYVDAAPGGGRPVFHLIDREQVDAIVAVPESLMSRFAVKQPIEIVSAVNPEVRAASEITSVGQVADKASGTYRIRVRIPNMDGRFAAGMVVTAVVAGQSSRPVVRIPVDTIQRAYGQSAFVLLVDPEESRVVSREIQIGPAYGRGVEITAGLSGGELLIVRGQHFVIAGDRVNCQFVGDQPAGSTARRSP